MRLSNPTPLLQLPLSPLRWRLLEFLRWLKEMLRRSWLSCRKPWGLTKCLSFWRAAANLSLAQAFHHQCRKKMFTPSSASPASTHKAPPLASPDMVKTRPPPKAAPPSVSTTEELSPAAHPPAHPEGHSDAPPESTHSGSDAFDLSQKDWFRAFLCPSWAKKCRNHFTCRIVWIDRSWRSCRHTPFTCAWKGCVKRKLAVPLRLIPKPIIRGFRETETSWVWRWWQLCGSAEPKTPQLAEKQFGQGLIKTRLF